MFIQKLDTFAMVMPGLQRGEPPAFLSCSFGAINSAPSGGATIKFQRDSEIVAQEAAAIFCFQVVAGCVRTTRLLDDGRRQVGEFLLAGDLFGWEADSEYRFGAEAVTEVTLHRFRLSTIEDNARTDPAFARWLQKYAAGQLRAARERVVSLGRNTAAERVSAFLLEMQHRSNGQSGAPIDLPMNRTDIADYLGLTVETVCRALSDLRRQGAIEIERTRIFIHDRRALCSEPASLH